MVPDSKTAVQKQKFDSTCRRRKRYRKYTYAERLELIRRVMEGQNASEAAKELKFKPTLANLVIRRYLRPKEGQKAEIYLKKRQKQQLSREQLQRLKVNPLDFDCERIRNRPNRSLYQPKKKETQPGERSTSFILTETEEQTKKKARVAKKNAEESQPPKQVPRQETAIRVVSHPETSEIQSPQPEVIELQQLDPSMNYLIGVYIPEWGSFMIVCSLIFVQNKKFKPEQ